MSGMRTLCVVVVLGCGSLACELVPERPGEPPSSDGGVSADAGVGDGGAWDAGGSPPDVGGGATDAGPPGDACLPRDTDAPPRATSFPARLAGQDGWIHDEGFPAGYFHTFDALKLTASDTPRKVHVFLPRSYTTGCKRYPVLYFNDGDTTFFPGGAANKTWDVASALAREYAARTTPEVIIVAVHPLEREREYTHVPWLPGRACCGLAGYTAWLADSLKPFVDGAYRTLRGPADTVAVGSSHGGLASFWAATTRPGVFGKAIAMSASFWAGLDSVSVGGPLDGSALLQAAGAGLASRPRLYVDWGLVRTGGTHNSLIEERATARGRELSGLLQSRYGYTPGIDLFVVEDPLGEHDELSWGRRIGPALASTLGPR